MATKSLTKVFNPEADRIPITDESVTGVSTWSMAPRLDSLENKTVYLVNQGFGGSELFMEQFQAWFAENMPEVNTVLKRKTNNMFTDEPELWAEIKEKGDAMILGVGG